MAINLPGGQRFDSRGLPEGYDPHKLYEYRQETLVKNSAGLESFLYRYIPLSVVKSLAFAIDPTYAFKVAPMPITSANRTKYRQTASATNYRRSVRRFKRFTYGQIPNYQNVQICWSPYAPETHLSIPDQVVSKPGQPPLPAYLKDTTSRTRLVGSTQGTLELFKGDLISPSRHVYRSTTDKAFFAPGSPSPQCLAVGGTDNNRNGGFESWSETFEPYGAVLSLYSYNALRTGEIAFAKALCQKHAISMLKDWSPEKRSFSFFRSLVELRDVPRSISSLRKSMDDLRKFYYSLPSNSTLRKKIFDLNAVARDIPGEYLSFHFGWKQLYKDIMDLLDQPNRLSKKFNFLAKRNGKPTTFRVARNFPSESVGVSGFDYEVSPYEYSTSTASRIERESEVRLVINALFDFPTINTPEFNTKQFRVMTGIQPRFTDIYNLIPWTWLLDWFTGMGNYVELIDQINHDHSLVNWGMISCRTNGKLITDFKSKSNMVTNIQAPSGNSTSTQVVENQHQSVFDFSCQTRNNVATILDVKLTSVPSTLTAYQKSIIGALLLQRTNHFRPKS